MLNPIRFDGIKTSHSIISDECRKKRVAGEVMGAAMERVWAQWEAVDKAWPIGRGTKFHLVLIVEPGATHE